MLGHAVHNELRDKCEVIVGYRDPQKLRLLHGVEASVQFSATWPTLNYLYALKPDWVINASGVTIPFAGQDVKATLFVNGVFPHLLAHHWESRLIHISTDCVYDGREGGYDENSRRSPTDIYGMSKSIGEPEECLTLRTSIIGRELHGFTGLVEWFLKQGGKTIQGFGDHFWNGITTKQYAKICWQIMNEPGLERRGIHHIYSTTLPKYEMLCAFKKHFKVDVNIEEAKGSPKDRTLATVKPLNRLLEVPPFGEMLNEI